MPGRRRRRQPRAHAASAHRVRPSRWVRQHGRDRQLGRVDCSDHESTSRCCSTRSSPRRPHREATQHAPRRDDRRGRRPRPAGQLRADTGAQHVCCAGGAASWSTSTPATSGASSRQAGWTGRSRFTRPDDETLTERKAAGQGLTSPEFAILLSYTKVALYELLASICRTTAPGRRPERYFPTAVRQRFRTRLARHSLRREIVAAQFTNGLVNRVQGRPSSSVWARRPERPARTSRGRLRWRATCSTSRASGARSKRLTAVSRRRRSSPCSSRRGSCSNARPAGSCGTGRGRRDRRGCFGLRRGARSLAASVGDVLCAPDRDAARLGRVLVAAGVPPALADRVGYLESILPALDLVDVAAATGE